ncbi:MAG: hypothetical protein VYD87_05970 [Pseudomonadota bacterium]|nr:hypothetical protein [Pseudomonadota bacterium]
MSAPAFDVLRMPLDLLALDAWLAVGRPEPHEAPGRTWREWWSVRELIRRQDPADPVIAPGDVVARADRGAGDGRPDFLLFRGTARFAVEATIAGTTEDLDEDDEFRSAVNVHELISRRGGRFADGALGDEWEVAMAADIARAAEAKRGKVYAPGAVLLVHCRSNAMMADPAGVAAHLSRHGDAAPFREVVALVPGGALIRWAGRRVGLFAPARATESPRP